MLWILFLIVLVVCVSTIINESAKLSKFISSNLENGPVKTPSGKYKDLSAAKDLKKAIEQCKKQSKQYLIEGFPALAEESMERAKRIKIQAKKLFDIDLDS